MLQLSRQQILAHRRKVSALDERLPKSSRSLELAASAGLQDSMPRAALLSIHARVSGTEPGTWEQPPLVQVWGLRYSAFVIAQRDLALFTLGRLPEERSARQRAEDTANRLGGRTWRRAHGLSGRGSHRRLESQRLAIRGSDRPVPHLLGRLETASDLDRAATLDRPRRGPPPTGPAPPACLRPLHAGLLRLLGRGPPQGGECHLRLPQR